MVKRAVTLLLTHEIVEDLKRRRINISAHVDFFLAELVFAIEHGTTIRIGRKKAKPVLKGLGPAFGV